MAPHPSAARRSTSTFIYQLARKCSIHVHTFFKGLLTERRMAKRSSNGTMHILLLMVFMGLSRMVLAVDIRFSISTLSCIGTTRIFSQTSEGICYSLSGNETGGPVTFLNLDLDAIRNVYLTTDCSGNPAASNVGTGCFGGDYYKSALWRRPKYPSHIAESDVVFKTTKCDCEAKLTAIVFIEDAQSGSWMLKVPDADELFSQLESLPHGEKVNWLKTKGAAFFPSTADIETDI